jgi:AraC-like DNA-binding protein
VTVSEIAHRWGFPDHANFTRAFHRAYGMSPRDYRKRFRTAIGGPDPA